MGKKLGALAELDPDVAIIPEGSDPALLRPAAIPARMSSSLWTGRLATKGLAVIGFGEWSVRLAVPVEPSLEWIIPAAVHGPQASFALLAVWAMNHRAAQRYPEEPKRRQVQQAVHRYPDLFASDAVVAGDLNNHVRWDKPGKPSNHAAAAELLGSKGLVSAYHRDRDVSFGDEPEPTIYWRNRTIDGPG